MPSSIIVMCGEVKQCSVRCIELMRVRSTASICENIGLPYAEEYIGAG